MHRVEQIVTSRSPERGITLSRAQEKGASCLAFWDLADKLKQRGGSALIVSHMLIDRERLNRAYSMQDGRAVLEG
jgi:hypothetical protein